MLLISLDILNKKHKSGIDPEVSNYGALRLYDCAKFEELHLNRLVSKFSLLVICFKLDYLLNFS